MNELKRFIGHAKAAVDGKGRCAFPREFRCQLTPEDGTEFVLTYWAENKLRLFVRREYEKFMDELDQWSDRKLAEQFRLTLRSTLVELDGQNRILLPKDKILYANLANGVTFVEYRGKSLELWNTDRYDAKVAAEVAEAQAKFDDLCFNAVFAGGSNDQK
ncbi:division/cell wall cluster transcriptional repressor MraZ [Fibrobacter sp.]|uniref:division/cell wall cluster transcriptional repressor MraZ n=1 Tax=Fibrobacter sp. TaxID=35828 RepID=UPI00388D99A6